ncbi:MAG: glycine/sarcosine/betaine reductase complex component C subunit alpha [Defluviitaleaceae bacterium]|nr:glycine/sarcosine/betaine reductase complex component C subunit alpha [Defluviitaleaceae bacterium]
MEATIKKIIAKTFDELATGLETGSFGGAPKIALMGVGSEHGEAEMQEGADMAASRGLEAKFIGGVTEAEATEIIEKMLKSGEADGAVAMHYTFPIGVATVGKVVTPATGRSLYITTTTGSSATDRVAAMVRNAIYGIIAAKASGVANPSVGILNIDGARQVERALREIADNGYNINFAQSKRSDGGVFMRGNDVLNNPCDVLVCDSLTGNVLMKLLSGFTTGGSYEATGFGYGPGIGENSDQLVLIVSRASGAPVVAGAMEYAAQLVKGDWKKVLKAEFAAANAAGLRAVLEKITEKSAPVATETVVAPPKEIVTAEISGIEITELDDAVNVLWKASIYAESGMGCTGPIVLVNESKLETAQKILKDAGFVSE